MLALRAVYPSVKRSASALDLRLSALSEMVRAGVLAGWAKGTDGTVDIAEPAWEIAASEPLTFDTDLPSFNLERFLARLISDTPSEGSA